MLKFLLLLQAHRCQGQDKDAAQHLVNKFSALKIETLVHNSFELHNLNLSTIYSVLLESEIFLLKLCPYSLFLFLFIWKKKSHDY